MLVHIDGHSVTGSIHIDHNIPCQDAFSYAIEGDNWMIALADGCTGDGKARTQEGARLLVNASIALWRGSGVADRNADEIGDDIIDAAVREMAINKLSLVDLASTLLLAFPEQDGIRILMWGDGAFGWRYGGHETQAISVSWSFNTPPYLVYRHSNEAALNMHVMMDHESGVVYTYPGGVKTLIGIKEGFAGLEWRIPWVDSLGRHLEWAGLFSDGIERVHNCEPDDVIHDLMDGPSGGRFAIRALKKLVEGAGLPGDDLTLCCARFIPEIEED